ncbi:MAG: DUF4159 domain-containing protein [Spiribacter salinus]|uniref:DUF4159 domain-containing protein n=2 Tax=Gammaproteobacteria TaxID=1236 RepID=A0A540VVM2_9GAMM|nr:MAG: DUF4159 domain-containing protein [Spiribacter salinus]
MSLGPILFTAPYVLLALALLPVLWILLRAVPPAPIRLRFPAVALLLGIRDEESTSDRTPWWLLLLRMLVVAAVIVGLAGPVLNPKKGEETGQGRLLIVLDASWASASDWEDRRAYLQELLNDAARQERPVAILKLTAPEPTRFRTAGAWRSALAGLRPEPWEAVDLEAVEAALPEGAFDTLWVSDAVKRETRGALLELFEARGQLTIAQGSAPLYAMQFAPSPERGIALDVQRLKPAGEATVQVQALGLDPAGTERVLESVDVRFTPGVQRAEAVLDVPPELQTRISRFEVAGARHAGATVLADDSLRRRQIGLVEGGRNREGLELLSPLHYLEKALLESAELRSGAIEDVLTAKPDAVILADIAEMTESDETALIKWTEAGGLLVRFAGPKVAASDVSRQEEHPLMPVRLRAGGRFVGGAMSWGEPKALAPFERESPFFGLTVDEELRVSAQVVAQPGPELSERVIARLSDGTPLVTRKKLGRGEVVLFHIAANAEWSNVPLSGLFVRMLERLSIATSSGALEESEMDGTIWQPVRLLDGFGRLEDASGMGGVDGLTLLDARIGPELPPGLYEGPGRRVALNTLSDNSVISPASWPARVARASFGGPQEQPLAGPLFAFALLLLVVDMLATLALSGRLRGAAVAALALALVQAPQAEAQEVTSDDSRALNAASEIVLAHVLTGDSRVDEIAAAGLLGLSETLFYRTSVEPDTPQGIDLERDELAFYPMLYWPITADQPIPSDGAYDKLNAYLRAGGMILFDTRDSNVARFGASSETGRALQSLAAPLDIPELEPVPEDHVLTRTFYLLQDFPGRHVSRDVWVEAAPTDAERAEGMPFRNLNDGVTPVVIGGNDWGAAWAIDSSGSPLLPVGRGFSGERQRELAYRFGVNLVMHVLTGNYKSDQVHVPALLERLGQ